MEEVPLLCLKVKSKTDGEEYDLHVPADITCESLRVLVGDIYGEPLTDQTLIVGGHVIRRQTTLQRYAIRSPASVKFYQKRQRNQTHEADPPVSNVDVYTQTESEKLAGLIAKYQAKFANHLAKFYEIEEQVLDESYPLETAQSRIDELVDDVMRDAVELNGVVVGISLVSGARNPANLFSTFMNLFNVNRN